ncbi:rhodanese-like domain-containing protein [Tropicimonas sp. S265A]|uniref:rhodanese-like domain-containing protein n=1 Tax=Tropicimonas sp. S265A TaxID=3415134 RepID=UPI003C7AD3DE
MRFRHWIAWVICAVATSGPGLADPLPASKQTRLGLYMTAEETARFLSQTPEAIMIDVRTRQEIDETGLAEGTDALIPLAIPDARKGSVLNPDFFPGIVKLANDRRLRPDQPIVLICRSGNRSAHAANALAEMGFTQVYTVTDGYEGDRSALGQRTVNGWKNAGLPWATRRGNSCAPAQDGGAC